MGNRIIVLLLVLSFILISIPVSVMGADLNVIEVEELSIRYDENLSEGDWLKGAAYTTAVTVWGDYLLTAVNYSGECPGIDKNDRSVIAVYRLASNRPVLVGKWNKADLGIPVRTEDGSAGWEDIINGLYIDDDYLCIGTHMGNKSGSSMTNGWKAGIYVYQNPLKEAVFPSSPTRMNLAGTNEEWGCLIGSWNQPRNSVDTRHGYAMTVIKGQNGEPDKLVSFYDQTGINGDREFTVINITEDTDKRYVKNTKLNNFLIYTDDKGTEDTADDVNYSATSLQDVAFEGNIAYVLATLNKEGNTTLTNGDNSFKCNTMAIFKVNFSDAELPVIDDVFTFDGDYNNSRGYSNASLTLEENYAYISTFSQSTSNLDEGLSHIYALSRTADGFEVAGRYSMSGDLWAFGYGQVQVIGNVLVGMPIYGLGGSKIAYMELSDDRTQMLSCMVDTSKTYYTMVYSARSAKYKSKVIFGCSSTDVNMGTGGVYDTNRGILYIVDTVGLSGEWEDISNKKENEILNSFSASFDNGNVVIGDNTLRIQGRNETAKSLDFYVLLALYKDGCVEDVITSEDYSIPVGGEINISETLTIDKEKYATIAGLTVRGYLWDSKSRMIPVAEAVSPETREFGFEIPEDSRVSAGVYNSDNKLVRTLWSGEKMTAGSYTREWDALDDYGNVLPDGDYTVKIQTNNVEYEHILPVIGNTTDCSGWDTFISGYCSVFDMAYDRSRGRFYSCSDHVEGGYGLRYINEDSMRRTGGLLTGNGGNNTATHVAADGTRVYWGASENDAIWSQTGTSRAFIYATQTADEVNGKATSAEGKRYDFTGNEDKWVPTKWYDADTGANWTDTYQSSINLHEVTNQPFNRIGGLEVQQNGNLLFSAFRDAGKLYINDKNTGDKFFEMTINEPSAMAMSRGNDKVVYVAYKTDNGAFSVAKYNVSGTTKNNIAFTKEKDVITGLETVLGMAVSEDGSLLALAEGGTQDKLKVYSVNNNYAQTITYGTGESYADDPTVKPDKFMFDDLMIGYNYIYEHSFIEFAEGATLYLGDSGNGRILELDVSGSQAVENIEGLIANMRCSYSASVVEGDETKFFLDDREYTIDYEAIEDFYANRTSKYDYIGFENTWTLNKNYLLYFKKHFPDVLTGGIMTTFARPYYNSNTGYTYFRQRLNDGSDIIMKQDANGNLSTTGMTATRMDLHTDGLWYSTKVGNKVNYWCKPLTGYDQAGNPIFGEAIKKAYIDYDLEENKHATMNSYEMAVTDDGKLITLNSPGPAVKDSPNIKMHLGAIDISGGVATEYEWLAAPETKGRNKSGFPQDGYFELGTYPQYTTNHALVYGEHIMFHYRGEGYRDKQANSFLHFSDEGLLVGVFGQNQSGRGEGYDAWGDVLEVLPCNSMSTSIAGVPGNSDIAYIFQNSEGAAGGGHITRVTGLDSLTMLEPITITLLDDLIPGITYTCFDDAGLDIVEKRNTGITNTFEIPFITSGEGSQRSVEFTGFFKPSVTGTQRFAVQTDGRVRIFMDNEKLIDCTGDGNASMYMDENRLYSFEIEVTPNENGELTNFNMAYMEEGVYKYLNSNHISSRPLRSEEETTVNLLEGINYAESYVNGFYGWEAKMPLTTEKTMGTLSVIHNSWNYRHDASSDVFIDLKPGSKNTDDDGNFAGGFFKSDMGVTRNLGEVESDSWKLDMDVLTYGEFTRELVSPTQRKADGSAIELVDKNGRVIANFWIAFNYSSPYFHVMVNDTEIMKIQKPYNYANNYSECRGVGFRHNFEVVAQGNINVNYPKNLVFECVGNQVKITYAGNEMVCDVVDSGADITAPAELRFVAWQSAAWTQANRYWNVTRLELTK